MVKAEDDDPESGQMKRFAIRADVLDQWFPEFIADLVRNSFVSINASYTLSNHSKTAPHGHPKHDSEHLRFLCACYVDLDYYNLGLTVREVRAELERMRESGLLPDVSIEVDSGHGMWLLWLLHDPSQPEIAHLGAYADNRHNHLQLYTRINKALHKQLSHLGADAISDGVRHIRVPGSWRNDEETFVRWSIRDQSDRVVSYTLKGLAERVGVSLSARPKAELAALRAMREGNEGPSRAWVKTNQNRLAAFVTIKDLRAGGFAQGCRNKAGFLYAMSLKAIGVERREAEHAVIEMGSHCTPPLPAAASMFAVKEGFKTKRAKLCYQTMADWLDVSPSEAEIVTQVLYASTQRGDRRFFPAAQRFGDLRPITNTSGTVLRATKKVARHDALRQILADSAHVPSVREMQAALLGVGIEVSLGSLHADYKELELVSRFVQRRQQAEADSLESRKTLRAFFAA
jgi:hypothetical protein